MSYKNRVEELLQVLLESKGQPLSKEELSEMVGVPVPNLHNIIHKIRCRYALKVLKVQEDGVLRAYYYIEEVCD